MSCGKPIAHLWESYQERLEKGEDRKKVMDEWYRQKIKERIPRYIQKWEDKLKVKVNDWRVRRMTTRWGTCNVKAKRIWINLELVKKPEYCLEYIVLHEILHLVERKHNKRYIAHLDKYMPKWRNYKEELNKLIISLEKFCLVQQLV